MRRPWGSVAWQQLQTMSITGCGKRPLSLSGRKDVPAALKRWVGMAACVQEDRQKRRFMLAEPPHQGAARGLCLSSHKLFLANDTGKLCAFSRVPPGGSQIVDNIFNNVLLLTFLGCMEQGMSITCMRLCFCMCFVIVRSAGCAGLPGSFGRQASNWRGFVRGKPIWE